MQELENLNKEELIGKMVKELPKIRSELDISYDDLERTTGIGAKRIAAFEEGRQVPKWSEYLSIVFVLWTNESCRPILDEKGLFPLELKKVFSINRNAHDPTV